MSKRKNRKHSKIDMLDPAVKAEVESMIISNNFTYGDIVEYIQSCTGEMISKASVCRYARGLCESLESIRFAQENFRAISAELNRNPNLDTTEGIIQILSHLMLNNIRGLSEEDFKDVDPLKIMKQASELIRAAAYKRNLDIKNKELTEMGFDAVKEKVFAVMSREDPKLYKQVSEFIDKKKSELEDG